MSVFQHTPLSRHDALAPFSRDHYLGLVQSRHLIKAARADAVARRKALAEFVDAWNREIAQHFGDEERLLTNLMEDEDRRRLLDEHHKLAELAAQARRLRQQVDPDSATLRQIGQMLEQHIRWEERDLFNRLQKQLTDQQMARLQRETAKMEASRPRKVTRKSMDHDQDAKA